MQTSETSMWTHITLKGQTFYKLNGAYDLQLHCVGCNQRIIFHKKYFS